jgi:hypothetical protein
MDTLAKGLRANVYVHQNSLWSASNTRISVGDRDGSDFGWTSNHAWKCIRSLSFALDESLEN